MQAKRCLTGLIATVATATAIMAGPALATTVVYHGLNTGATQHVTVVNPVADTAPSDAQPDTYHDT